MKYLRVAACLVALIFSLSSMAIGGDVTYSGVPGKWKRGAKEAKGKDQEPAPTKSDLPKPTDPGEKDKRTKTIPAPTITIAPGTPEKK